LSNLTAVLGPTNTGKTHYAIERMLAHDSGMIGLPLRLLAREVYDRVVKEKGARAVALITGEERIAPETARYFICTVEAMPVHQPVAFLAIDEAQLAADPDRGHVFTERILNARGTAETLLLGSDTLRPALAKLDLGAVVSPRERFSALTYSGPTKITRLPKRTAVIGFSAEEVYAIAELLKRHRGGAAVVMGALSPRTRNAQVALYQSGEVGYLVATDAIGMGLNMDVDHVAFASRRKFDGHRTRLLRADELAQIAGRAGRFRSDGTFGETGDCPPFEPELVQRIEGHAFDPLSALMWRSTALDFASPDALLASLSRPVPNPILRQAPYASDELALRAILADPAFQAGLDGTGQLRRLWDVCGLPDFRKSGPDTHARLVASIFERLRQPDGRIGNDWMDGQMSRIDNCEGDIDTLQVRLAAIRTWAYAAERSDWLAEPAHWRGRTHEVEERLSDALHNALTQRFVDRRTSALISGLKREDALVCEVSREGDVKVEGHFVGRLTGLSFLADVAASSLEGRAVRNAAMRSLRPEIAARLNAIRLAEKGAFQFSQTQDIQADAAGTASSQGDPGTLIVFDGAPVARLQKGRSRLSPEVVLIGAEEHSPAEREAARTRIAAWVEGEIAARLGPLASLSDPEALGLTGLARGLAWSVYERGGVLAGADMAAFSGLGFEDRKALKQAGLVAGRAAAFVPAIINAAGVDLSLRLYQVGTQHPAPLVPPAGLPTSFAVEAAATRDGAASVSEGLAAAFYLLFGQRAVRVDMAERLAFTLAGLAKAAKGQPFAVPLDLAALVGCPADAFTSVLTGIGLRPAQYDVESGAVQLWRAPAAGRSAATTARPLPKPPAEARARGRKPADSAVAAVADARSGSKAAGTASAPRKPRRSETRPPERAVIRPAPAPDPNNPFAALAGLRAALVTAAAPATVPAPSQRPKRPKKPKPAKQADPASDRSAPAAAGEQASAKPKRRRRKRRGSKPQTEGLAGIAQESVASDTTNPEGGDAV
jgi:ATP-dependent RNA helicase SUPV3L1/SUV3